jgi:hypothetical protein
LTEQKTCNVGEEMQWGMKILHLRLTAAGHMLDLRFRVLDPAKAAYILSRNNKAYILDQESGKALPVPVTKGGPLRQTSLKPQSGRVYFILFSNAGGIAQEGSKMTLAIGDIRIKDITVQGAGAQSAEKDGELPELNESQIKKWKAIKEVLQKEYAVCVEHCGNEKSCLDKCDRAHAAREKNEYLRLMYQEQGDPDI